MYVASRRRLIAFVLVASSIASVGSLSVRAEDTPVAEVPAPTADDLRRADWIAEGRAKFISACSYCHGQQGEAGKVRSFKERKNWNPQTIHDTITNGRIRGANIMPPWGGSIPDDEIWKIVSYIKSLSLDFPGAIDTTK